MRRCSAEGCRRRCMAPYTECQNHRPAVKIPQGKVTEAHRVARVNRDRKRRALAGLPSGWEAA
jgi:hypothetical protein